MLPSPTLAASPRSSIRIVRPETGAIHILADQRDGLEGLSQAGLRVRWYESLDALIYSWECSGAGCILLGVDAVGRDPADSLDVLREAQVRWPVVVLLHSATVKAAVRAMKLGAFDVIVRPIEAPILMEVVRAALMLDAQNCERRAERHQFRARCQPLTARERQVVSMVVRGMSNKEIASCLGIRSKTVEVHRKNVMRKLQVHTAIELVSSMVQFAGDLADAWLPRDMLTREAEVAETLESRRRSEPQSA